MSIARSLPANLALAVLFAGTVAVGGLAACSDSGADAHTDASEISPQGLVAAYAFDEGTGTTTADATGGGHVATIARATWSSAGRFGKALHFDGTSSRVSVAAASALDLATAMTLEAWVKPEALRSWNTILLKENGKDLSYGLYANSDAAVPVGIAFSNGAEHQAKANGALVVGAWSHVATTYDGSVVHTYVNGVLVGSTNASGAMPRSSGPLSIGSNAIWGEYFRGYIDEVRVYARALSASEIQTDMQSPVTGTTPPSADGGSPPPPPPPPPNGDAGNPPPPPLPGASIFIATSGSDANSCTAQKPCLSFDRAYHVAPPGAVVSVAAGTYTSQTINSDATKTAAEDVVFDGGGATVAYLQIAGSHLTVRNVKTGGWGVSPGSDDVTLDSVSAHGTIFITSATNVTVKGGEVESVGTYVKNGSEVKACTGCTQAPTNIVFDGVYFHDVLKTPGSSDHVDCLHVMAGNGIVVKNSKFHTCEHYDILFTVYGLPGTPTNVSIENNFFGQSMTGLPGLSLGGGHGEHFVNYLVRNNSMQDGVSIGDATTDASSNVRFTNNIAGYFNTLLCGYPGVTWKSNVFASTSNATLCGTGNIVAPSGFRDAANHDFHLVPGAAAINHADPSDFPATDIDGETRPKGGAPDVGADEAM